MQEVTNKKSTAEIIVIRPEIAYDTNESNRIKAEFYRRMYSAIHQEKLEQITGTADYLRLAFDPLV